MISTQERIEDQFEFFHYLNNAIILKDLNGHHSKEKGEIAESMEK